MHNNAVKHIPSHVVTEELKSDVWDIAKALVNEFGHDGRFSTITIHTVKGTYELAVCE